VLPADPAAVARLGIAHVPEGRGLIPNLSVRDNLRLGVAALGKRFRADHWDNAVAVFPAIGPLADRKAGYLSGGEQQMVAIARGLAAEPRILMIDELSLGLAPKIVVELLRTLSDVARRSRLGILLVDQNVRALAAVCGRLYTLQDGRSAPASLDDDSVLRSAYFGSGAKS
jgi:branched-chain amino acid transport system ATP-binding protein